MNQSYSDLPGYFCKIQGKIISFQPYISKSNCYDVYQIFIEHSKTGYIYQVYGTRNLHDTCFKESFYGGYIIQNILKLPNLYTLDKMLGKDQYFTIAQETFAESKDTELYIPSLIKDISEKKPDNFMEYPWCPIFLQKNVSPVIQDNTDGVNISFIAFIIGAMVLGGIFGGLIYKFFASRK